MEEMVIKKVSTRAYTRAMRRAHSRGYRGTLKEQRLRHNYTSYMRGERKDLLEKEYRRHADKFRIYGIDDEVINIENTVNANPDFDWLVPNEPALENVNSSYYLVSIFDEVSKKYVFSLIENNDEETLFAMELIRVYIATGKMEFHWNQVYNTWYFQCEDMPKMNHILRKILNDMVAKLNKAM